MNNYIVFDHSCKTFNELKFYDAFDCEFQSTCIQLWQNKFDVYFILFTPKYDFGRQLPLSIFHL